MTYPIIVIIPIIKAILSNQSATCATNNPTINPIDTPMNSTLGTYLKTKKTPINPNITLKTNRNTPYHPLPSFFTKCISSFVMIPHEMLYVPMSL